MAIECVICHWGSLIYEMSKCYLQWFIHNSNLLRWFIHDDNKIVLLIWQNGNIWHSEHCCQDTNWDNLTKSWTYYFLSNFQFVLYAFRTIESSISFTSRFLPWRTDELREQTAHHGSVEHLIDGIQGCERLSRRSEDAGFPWQVGYSRQKEAVGVTRDNGFEEQFHKSRSRTFGECLSDAPLNILI